MGEALKLRAQGDTPMFQAFEKACKQLASAPGLARIVMLTDGEPNQGYTKQDILHLVEKVATRYGIIVDCVGIGIKGKTVDYDEEFLRKLAEVGSGEFYPIEDIDQLVKRLMFSALERKALLGGGIKLLGSCSSCT